MTGPSIMFSSTVRCGKIEVLENKADMLAQAAN
jgi:hypothetical protein